ncbi:MAG: hypothetical protein ACRD9S_06275 [Pyrinomonadaceae bacterium]
MNILDENVARTQRELLEGWKIPVKQIGYNLGRRGMPDEEIIPLLVKQRRSIFFTRDKDFHNRGLCHALYCIVYLDVQINEAATFVRRLLRHPDFDTNAKRVGKVLRVTSGGISFWQINERQETRVSWKAY